MINIKGYIYKITNLVNQKCYIGQTIKTVEKRWLVHQSDARRKNRYSYNYPLYRAIRKYGIDNFSIETIEECDESILDEREIYWIKVYDSASKNGYNQTLGGGGAKHLDLDEQQVINTYKKTNTIIATAKIFNCSSAVIAQILQKNNVEIKSTLDQNKESGYDVIQYDSNHNEIRRFKTKGDAANWLLDNKISNSSYDTTRMSIRAAILNNYITYGYYWDSPSYTEEDKKIAQEKRKERDSKFYAQHFTKYHIINDKELTKTTKNDETSTRTIKLRTNNDGIITKINRCIICYTPILNTSKMCVECTKLYQKTKAIQQRESQGITREILKNKIKTQSFLSIGKEYGVTDNTIRKWCKNYGLPYKSLEIKKYTDEEWENI